MSARSSVFAKFAKFGKRLKHNDQDESVTKQINRQLKKEESKQVRKIEVLLLGTGGSGDFFNTLIIITITFNMLYKNIIKRQNNSIQAV